MSITFLAKTIVKAFKGIIQRGYCWMSPLIIEDTIGQLDWTYNVKKIPMYVKYIYKEYDIEVLEQTKKKNRFCNYYMTKCA